MAGLNFSFWREIRVEVQGCACSNIDKMQQREFVKNLMTTTKTLLGYELQDQRNGQEKNTGAQALRSYYQRNGQENNTRVQALWSWLFVS